MKTWILVANASEACLYDSENLRTQALNLLKKFDHPESREKRLDLTADRAGHYSTNHKARGRFEDKSDPKKVEADNFARELAEALGAGNNNHDFDQLVLVTSSPFYGKLNKHIDFTLDNLNHIDKDYTKLKAEELLEKLRKELFELK